MKRLVMILLTLAFGVGLMGCEHTARNTRRAPGPVIKHDDSPRTVRARPKITRKVEIGKCIAGTKTQTPSGRWVCKCPASKRFDPQSETCKVWFNESCSQASQCHPQVPLCKKGYGGGLAYGKAEKVCVNNFNYVAWQKNHFTRKHSEKPARIVIRYFNQGRVVAKGKKAYRKCKYSVCWDSQPVPVAKNGPAIKRLMHYANAMHVSGLNNTCSIKAQGVVDKTWKKKGWRKPKPYEPSLRDIHLRLADKRRRNAIRYMKNLARSRNVPFIVLSPTSIYERTKVTERGRVGGEDRKVIFTISCRKVYHSAGAPGEPANPPAPTVKETTIVNNSTTTYQGKKEFSHYAVKVGMFGLGALLMDSISPEFSFTILAEINWEFVKGWQVSLFAGAMYNGIYAPSNRYLDFAGGGALGYLPARWIELRVGFLQVSYAMLRGEADEAFLINRSLFAEANFILGPKKAVWAFTLGLACGIGWSHRNRLEPEFGGFCAGKLGFRLQFGKQYKKE